MDLAARESELRALAIKRSVDWEERLSSLPDDPRLRIAALATLLRINPIEALRADRPTKTLDTEARRRQRARQDYDRQERNFLQGLGLELKDEGQ